MSKPFIKICCIASRQEAELAISLGADALGLVSHMPSGPGVIADALVADIAAHVAGNLPLPIRRTVQTFLLTSRQTADAIAEQHAACKTTTLQLVDAVAPEELARLRRLLPGVNLVQVIHVVDDASVAEALALAPAVDMLLLDSGNQKLAVKELGGTGRTHDWRLSQRIVAQSPVPVLLAGGLHSGNVRSALASVTPFGLDICSNLRTAGALDANKLTDFMRQVALGPAAPASCEQVVGKPVDRV